MERSDRMLLLSFFQQEVGSAFEWPPRGLYLIRTFLYFLRNKNFYTSTTTVVQVCTRFCCVWMSPRAQKTGSHHIKKPSNITWVAVKSGDYKYRVSLFGLGTLKIVCVASIAYYVFTFIVCLVRPMQSLHGIKLLVVLHCVFNTIKVWKRNPFGKKCWQWKYGTALQKVQKDCNLKNVFIATPKLWKGKQQRSGKTLGLTIAANAAEEQRKEWAKKDDVDDARWKARHQRSRHLFGDKRETHRSRWWW